MTQERLTVSQGFQRGALLLGSSTERQSDIGAAKIRRKLHLGHRCGADARVRHLIPDQLVEFFADRLGKAFDAVGIQISAYNSNVKLILMLAWAAAAWGQPLSVYSEFARIGSDGNVVAPETPREILSPALARNAFASFQVVIQAPAGTRSWLYVGQNPENAVKVTLYRESGDALQPVNLPYEADGTQALWMDVWVDRDAPVQRIKIEPELNIHDDWVIYPMEARVTDARVPDDSKAGPMRTYLCGGAVPSVTTDVARLRLRNSRQDAAIAGRVSKDELKKLYGACNAPAPENPEWYLRIRDYLLQLR